MLLSLPRRGKDPHRVLGWASGSYSLGTSLRAGGSPHSPGHPRAPRPRLCPSGNLSHPAQENDATHRTLREAEHHVSQLWAGLEQLQGDFSKQGWQHKRWCFGEKGMAGLSPAPQETLPAHGPAAGQGHCPWVPHRARPSAGGLPDPVPSCCGDSQAPLGEMLPCSALSGARRLGSLPGAADTSVPPGLLPGSPVTLGVLGAPRLTQHLHGPRRGSAAPCQPRGPSSQGPCLRMLSPCREQRALREMVEENLAFASCVRMWQSSQAWPGSGGGCSCLGRGLPLLQAQPSPWLALAAPGLRLLDPPRTANRSLCENSSHLPSALLTRGPTSGEPCRCRRAQGQHPQVGRAATVGAGHRLARLPSLALSAPPAHGDTAHRLPLALGDPHEPLELEATEPPG